MATTAIRCSGRSATMAPDSARCRWRCSVAMGWRASGSASGRWGPTWNASLRAPTPRIAPGSSCGRALAGRPGRLGEGAMLSLQLETRAAIRVLLADDHAVVREGYRRLLELEPDMVVVGECPDAETARAHLEDSGQAV